jgi:hypothetical protein
MGAETYAASLVISTVRANGASVPETGRFALPAKRPEGHSPRQGEQLLELRRAFWGGSAIWDAIRRTID